MERLMKVLCVVVVMAIVSPAMATWYGGVLWTGAEDNVFSNPNNWDGSIDNDFHTVGLMVKTVSATGNPQITNDFTLGTIMVKNTIVDQTAGYAVFANGTGNTLPSLGVFDNSLKLSSVINSSIFVLDVTSEGFSIPRYCF